MLYQGIRQRQKYGLYLQKEKLRCKSKMHKSPFYTLPTHRPAKKKIGIDTEL